MSVMAPQPYSLNAGDFPRPPFSLSANHPIAQGARVLPPMLSHTQSTRGDLPIESPRKRMYSTTSSPQQDFEPRAIKRRRDDVSPKSAFTDPAPPPPAPVGALMASTDPMMQRRQSAPSTHTLPPLQNISPISDSQRPPLATLIPRPGGLAHISSAQRLPSIHAQLGDLQMPPPSTHRRPDILPRLTMPPAPVSSLMSPPSVGPSPKETGYTRTPTQISPGSVLFNPVLYDNPTYPASAYPDPYRRHSQTLANSPTATSPLRWSSVGSYNMSPVTAIPPLMPHGPPMPGDVHFQRPNPFEQPRRLSEQALHELTRPQHGDHPPKQPPQTIFRCDFPGCEAKPFTSQYLLNSHRTTHASTRIHFCPVPGCARGEGGKGFKRKNEMIRHGLVHDSPGYMCPYCVSRDHRYPRPDNLQRHVRVHHPDKDRDDPLLRDVLDQRAEGSKVVRRRKSSA